MTRLLIHCVISYCLLLTFTHAGAQETASRKKGKTPAPLERYKGRVIAQTMHYTGSEWLLRNEREREERCSRMLTALDVKEGSHICDMGCGNGFYTLKLAELVGDTGQIYAVDVQPEMLVMLNQRADQAGISNVTPILSTFVDPRLPRGEIDLILLVDVYHEFSNPDEMLKRMRASLAPGGAIVLVEYRAEDANVPIKAEHKMSKEQILKELVPNGFKLAKEFDKLPWQHMMWFEPDTADEATK